MSHKEIPCERSDVFVWDIFVRFFHWSLVTGYALNMLVLEDGDRAHRWIGYGVASLIVLRIFWGFFGTSYARFSNFVPSPRSLIRYLGLLMQGKDPRYIGHNPAGAVAMVLLIILMLGVCLTGWMQGLDRFWGEEWLEQWHERMAQAIFVLALIHVFAAIIEGLRHRENLILSMITGKKRPPSPEDVDFGRLAKPDSKCEK